MRRRHKRRRVISKERLKILIENICLSNRELAEMLDISRNAVALHKTRLRKKGLNVPCDVRRTIDKDMNKIILEMKLKNKLIN